MYLNYVISIALSESLTSLPFRYEEKSIFWIQLTEISIRCYHCYIARQLRYTIKYMDMAKEGNMLMEETGDPESLR